MEDIRQLHNQVKTAATRNPAAVPALTNALAEAIIALPHGAGVTECSFFAEAHALALPRIEAIAALNRKAQWWAGAKFGV